MTAELLRVEQYVEMVLHYLRLESESTDYVLRETEIDPLLRQAVRRYAPLFIRSRVSLQLEETGLRVLTDGKWLGFVVEQLLSNAVKYAPGGDRPHLCGGGDPAASRTTASASRRRICPGSLSGATPGRTAAWSGAPPASASFSAGRSAAAWATASPSPPVPGEGTEVRLDLHREKLEAE